MIVAQHLYQKKAARTLIDCPPRSYEPQELMLVWNAIGLAGEAGELLDELSSEEMEKELGDVLWYLSALFTIIKAPLPILSPLHAADYGLNKALRMLVVDCAKVVDEIKKQIFHDHGFNSDEIYALLCDVCDSINRVLWANSIDIEKVMGINIAKLDERYPEGFSSEDSISRVDVA